MWRWGVRIGVALVAAVVALVASVAFPQGDALVDHVIVADALPRPTTTTTTTTTTTLPPTTTTVAPSTTAARAPVTTVRRAPPTTRAPVLRQPTGSVAPASAAPFSGLGSWLDVFDWSREFTGGRPAAGPGDVDRMADRGVQVLYIQTGRHQSEQDVVDRDLLTAIIGRARQRGMRVVAWYVPTMEDPARDLRRLLAADALGVDAVGVDIESRAVADTAERNRRLVDLSIALRQRLPGVSLGAIVMPAVVMDVINPAFWPSFPYRELAPAYDVWMPMSYWTNRSAGNEYRDAYRYTAENIDRLRAHLERADVPVHAIGGIGDQTTTADLDGYLRASFERGAIGGGLYDYRTTGEGLWSGLRPFRA